MGSIMMHLAISSIVGAELTIKNEFILGGLAPDLQQPDKKLNLERYNKLIKYCLRIGSNR